jgi:low temperature requirement protein LtrA
VHPTSEKTRDFDSGERRVSTVELFYDLVYVFAVTQLSRVLVEHTTVSGALQAAILLSMVWQVWVYTTWTINYLDPGRTAVRVMLLVLMLASLVLAAELPDAFHGRAWAVAITYVAMQVGRSAFAIWAMRALSTSMVFVRILPWSAFTGVLVLIGAAVPDPWRALLWAGSVALDLLAAAFGFFVPGLGRAQTSDWTISGSHFAERCQAFVLIALGESIVVIGSTLHGFGASPDATQVIAFGCAFATSIGLWWIYFDRSADDSAEHIAASGDPGRIARNAFHWVHPLIVAGIIVGAAADDKLLEHPHAHGHLPAAWLLFGGAALYLLGHALFKYVVWRRVSWPRIGVALVLFGLISLGSHLSALVIALCVLVGVLVVAVLDRLLHVG